MKKIVYQIMGYTDVYNPETVEVEKRELLATVTRPYSEATEEIAKREAHNGEYTIEDDGEEDPTASPSLETRVDALEADSAEMAEALDMILNGVTE